MKTGIRHAVQALRVGQLKNRQFTNEKPAKYLNFNVQCRITYNITYIVHFNCENPYNPTAVSDLVRSALCCRPSVAAAVIVRKRARTIGGQPSFSIQQRTSSYSALRGSLTYSVSCTTTELFSHAPFIRRATRTGARRTTTTIHHRIHRRIHRFSQSGLALGRSRQPFHPSVRPWTRKIVFVVAFCYRRRRRRQARNFLHSRVCVCVCGRDSYQNIHTCP